MIIIKTKIKRSKFADILFYLAYTVYMIVAILSTTFFYQYYSEYYRILMYIPMILLALRWIILLKTNKREMVGFFIGFVLSVTLTNSTSGARFLSIILLIWFVFSARGMDFIEIAKYTIKISLILLVIVVVSSKIGIIENYVGIASDGRERQYLGFLYSLYPTSIYSNILLLEVYISRENISVKKLLILMAGTFYMYSMTYSRLVFGLSCLVLFLAFVFKIFPKLLIGISRIQWMFQSIFIVLATFSIYLQLTFSKSIAWHNTLDKILEGRLLMGHYALLQYGVKAFGTNILWVGSGLSKFGEKTVGVYNYVDNFYAQIVVQYGLIFFVIMILLLTFMMYKSIKINDYYAVIIWTILAFHGLIDDLILFLHYNTFWLLIGTVLLNNKEKIIIRKSNVIN